MIRSSNLERNLQGVPPVLLGGHQAGANRAPERASGYLDRVRVGFDQHLRKDRADGIRSRLYPHVDRAVSVLRCYVCGSHVEHHRRRALAGSADLKQKHGGI